MKICLITTTVYVPEVLRAYRAQDKDVEFIIAGDRKTPHDEVEALCEELGHATYLGPDEQESMYPDLSAVIGWDCVQRRNIALIEAARSEPDVIVSIDDDNEPMDRDYFEQIREVFEAERVPARATGEWFNIGEFARGLYTYRGWPLDEIPIGTFQAGAAPCRTGVANGLIFGDPDVSAAERIVTRPHVTDYDPVARAGIALDPGRTWSPINSQNTAWDARLAPLAMVLPEVGRYDDIWASYIAQSVMRATDFQVRFGVPFVRQDRHEHDAVADLEKELLGMRHTDALVRRLRDAEVDAGASVLENLRSVCESLEDLPYLPHEFLDQWLEAWQ